MKTTILVLVGFIGNVHLSQAQFTGGQGRGDVSKSYIAKIAEIPISTDHQLILHQTQPVGTGDTLHLALRVGSENNPVEHLFTATWNVNYSGVSSSYIENESRAGDFLPSPIFFSTKINGQNTVDAAVGATTGEGVSGHGVLAYHQFKALASGTATFSLSNIQAQTKAEEPILLEGQSLSVLVHDSTRMARPSGEGGNASALISWQERDTSIWAGTIIFRGTESSPSLMDSIAYIPNSATFSTEFIDQNLTNGTRYFYAVQSLSKQGYRNKPSHSFSIQPAASAVDFTTPTMPTTITAQVGHKRISLQWELEDNPANRETEVWYRIQGIQDYVVQSTAQTTLTLSGLTPNQEYEIRLRSRASETRTSDLSAFLRARPYDLALLHPLSVESENVFIADIDTTQKTVHLEFNYGVTPNQSIGFVTSSQSFVIVEGQSSTRTEISGGNVRTNVILNLSSPKTVRIGNTETDGINEYTVSASNRPFSTITPATISNVSGQISRNVTLRWESYGNTQTQVQVYVGSVSGSPVHSYDGTNSSTTMSLNESTTYVWRYRYFDGAQASSWSATSTFTTYSRPSSFEYTKSVTFGEYTQQSSYRLLAMPGVAERNFSVLGAESSDWIAYERVGSNYVQKNPTDTWAATKGYWVSSKKPLNITLSQGNTPLSSTDDAEVTLQAGWNIIANPMDKPISLHHIALRNNLSSITIHSFDGQYKAHTIPPSDNDDSWDFTLTPGQGYFYENTGQANAGLLIPYAPTMEELTLLNNNSLSTSTNSSVPSFSDRLNIAARLPELGFADQVSVVFSDEQQHKEYEIVGSPEGFAAIQLHIEDTLAVSGYKWRAKAVNAKSETGEIIPFRILGSAKSVAEVKIDVSELETKPEKMAVIHASTGEVWEGDSYAETMEFSFPMKEEHSFELLVGSHDFVNRKKEQRLPAIFALYQNYPNPFNPSTIISFSLPTEQHVRLEVFDVAGRRVGLIADRTLSKGFHNLSFDASGLSSGVYLYRLMSGSQVSTRKMILIR